MSCDKSAQLQAYYDVQLSAAEQSAMRAHVAQCADCAREIEALKRVSELVASSPMVELPPAAMARFERSFAQTLSNVRDRGVMRIASWLTAAAAAVLVGTVLVRPNDSIDVNRTGVWQTAAVMPPADSYDGSNGELVTVAQWMANDLSPGSEELSR